MNVKGERDRAWHTIGETAKLTGVSARTLRHYEDEGLLSPARAANGYRVYRPRDRERLGHILAMRACGLPLGAIRELLADPEANIRQTLADHLLSLRAQVGHLEDAVARTEAAIATIERIDVMDDNRKFEELKRQRQEQFEEEYGAEARERFGDDAIDATNGRMMALTKDEWDDKERLEEAIKTQLRQAMAEGDPRSEAAATLARMHER